MSVGKILKFLRAENGLTQEELANILNVKKSSIQKYESNEVPNLKVNTIRTLASTFGISASVIIFPEKYRDKDLKTVINLHEDLEKHYNIILSVLNDEGRNKVFEFAKDLKDSQNYKN